MYKLLQRRHGQHITYVIRVYRPRRDRIGRVLFEIDLTAGTVNGTPIIDVYGLKAMVSGGHAMAVTDWILERI